MKRELNVKKSTLIGILVLGISVNVFAEEQKVEDHKAGQTAEATSAQQRPGQEQKQLPGDLPYEGLLSSLKDNAGKEIETQVVPVGGSAVKGPNITKENLETIQKYVEGYKAFRLELEACNRDKDAGAKALATLLDTYTKKLKWSLFEKKDATGKVEIKKEADEKTLVTLSTQIKELLLARGERLKSDATKPFASEQEKKIAAWLDATHAMFFKGVEGKKEEVEKVVAEAKKAVEADVKAFKEIQEVDVCKLGAKPSTSSSSNSSTTSSTEKPVQNDDQVVPGTGNQGPGTGQPPGGGEQTPQVFGNQPIDPSAALAGLDAQFANRQAQQDELLRRALDEQARLAAELARQQNEALALQNQNNDEALAAALKALGQNNNDQPAVVAPPAPPAPISPPQISTGSGEQQQPLPQPQEQAQQQGPMPMMMPPMPQPSQPQIYVQEPSRFNQDEYNRPRNATVTTTVNPQSAGMLAQTQLLNALRMGANGQQGAYGQQTPNVMSSRLQGLSAGNPLRNASTQRSSSTTRATGATGAINATSGPQALAVSGRAKTVPSDLMRGSLTR